MAEKIPRAYVSVFHWSISRKEIHFEWCVEAGKGVSCDNLYLNCVSDLGGCQKQADAVALTICWYWVSNAKLGVLQISLQDKSSIRINHQTYLWFYDSMISFQHILSLPSLLYCQRHHSGKHQAPETYALQRGDSAKEYSIFFRGNMPEITSRPEKFEIPPLWVAHAENLAKCRAL